MATEPAPHAAAPRARFLTRDDRPEETRGFGRIACLSSPAVTGSSALTAMEVRLEPGGGHAFHRHPAQDELIYVVSGEIEQWLERERRTLRAGDALFVPRGVVHGSANRSDRPAVVLAILSPGRGADGYEVEDVFERAPWKDLLADAGG